MLAGVDPDARLVRRAQRGSRRAFDELVERHRDRTWRLVLGVVGSPEDAADVTQETWIAVIRHLGSFDGRARFTTWLHRIAVRKAYDHLRARRPEPVDPSSLRIPDARDGQRAWLQQRDILAALSRLDEGYRTAVAVVDLAGASIDEAAALMDVEPGTVKSRLFRGRAALAKQLGTWSPSAASDRGTHGTH